MSTPIYPYRAKLAPIVQEAGLKLDGLVADCLFPRVKTACRFEYIDWLTTDDNNGKADNLRKRDDLIGCYSKAKESKISSFRYLQGKLEDHALKIPLKTCCVTTCGNDNFLDDAALIEEVTDDLLISREFRAAELATDESAYTTRATTETDLAEGALFDLGTALDDENFNALKWFRELMEGNAVSGMFTTMVLPQWIVNKLIVHPSFKDGGCVVPAMTAMERISSLIGIQKVCIADTYYNAAAPGLGYDLQRIWGDYIHLSVSPGINRPNQARRVFGFTAYDKGFNTMQWFDEDMGAEGGFWGKAYHDLTEFVADRKASVLIKASKA